MWPGGIDATRNCSRLSWHVNGHNAICRCRDRRCNHWNCFGDFDRTEVSGRSEPLKMSAIQAGFDLKEFVASLSRDANHHLAGRQLSNDIAVRIGVVDCWRHAQTE